MQDHPGAPGTARQESTRSIVSTNDGGVATQPRAPGHERPRTASSGAARHGRLSAATRAPGADVPPTTTAGAPGQYRLRAVPAAPDHARSAARHTMAPGHERPLAASSDVARHGRPRATPRAPGADVPPATAAGAPGQHRPSAAQRASDHFRSRPAPRAPGHERPFAALCAAKHGRLSAISTAPGADVPPATTAGAPGQHRLRAVANATVASPAGQPRLRQGDLPHTPATPNTLTYPHSHQDTAPIHTDYAQAAQSPCTAGGLQGGQLRSRLPHRHSREGGNPPLSKCWRGVGGEDCNLFPPSAGGPLLSNQVHPAIQVPPQPRSCSTAAPGGLHQRTARAPPLPTPSPCIAGGP